MRPGEPSAPTLRARWASPQSPARRTGAHRRFAASPPDPQVRRDRAQLPAQVLARAEHDCAGVYAAVSAVTIIPFVERSRPLMMVLDMAVDEEEKLYRAGMTTVCAHWPVGGGPGGAGGLSPSGWPSCAGRAAAMAQRCGSASAWPGSPGWSFSWARCRWASTAWSPHRRTGRTSGSARLRRLLNEGSWP